MPKKKNTQVKEFRALMKIVREKHDEYKGLVGQAQTNVPLSVRSTYMFFSMTELLKEALSISHEIESACVQAFKKLEGLPNKVAYRALKKDINMSLITAHELTKQKTIMDTYLRLRKWLGPKSKKTNEEAQKELDKLQARNA